jgi:hypothetical protein
MHIFDDKVNIYSCLWPLSHMYWCTMLYDANYLIYIFLEMLEFMCNKKNILRVANMNVLVYKIVVHCVENNCEHYVS